jgi:hypothetical protein
MHANDVRMRLRGRFDNVWMRLEDGDLVRMWM